MALVICPRCDTLLKVHKVSETFFCPCGVELEHPDKAPNYSQSVQGNLNSQSERPQPQPHPNAHREITQELQNFQQQQRRSSQNGNSNYDKSHGGFNPGNQNIISQSDNRVNANWSGISGYAASASNFTSNGSNHSFNSGSNGSSSGNHSGSDFGGPVSAPPSEEEEFTRESAEMAGNGISHIPRTNSAPSSPHTTASTIGNELGTTMGSNQRRSLPESIVSQTDQHEVNPAGQTSPIRSRSVNDNVNNVINLLRSNTAHAAQIISSTLQQGHQQSNVQNENSSAPANVVGVVVDENKVCFTCKNKFKMLGRWKRVCKSCKKVVCNDCSRGKWPAAMLPKENNPKNERSLRVCTMCQSRTEEFRTALLEGNLEKAKDAFASGVLHLHVPYQIYPYKMYPIHCAILSGKIDLVKWLIQKRCNPRVLDARNWSGLVIAANEGHQDIVKHLLFRGYNKISEITDVDILQKCLQTAMIELHKIEINQCLQRYASNVNEEEEEEYADEEEGKFDETNLFAKTEEEEERQLRLAMKMSQKNTNGEDSNSNARKATKIQKIECVVCFERSVDCVLIPCGHMACCNECGAKFAECPVCRQKVEQVVKTYTTN